ncbi:MAG: DUF6198 family protein [Gemmiger sp.]|uniref:YczE/YyaS/YitT family protein n=1 Tax=Gemmiger sp. TaxID=2049027 RepID=UPI002E775440|nr:DUF6198 family protein [Gemmiger sp.]MEE0709848.1 DUF6198 family protein [Gemmiger sp.]
MTEICKMNRTALLKRIVFLCVGLTTMAFGVAFSIKAALGTSPISSVPYVTGAIAGLTIGTTTIIMNTLFVLIQIAILRRQYEWVQLLQLPAAVLFGMMIDLASYLIRDLNPTAYWQQWIVCLRGIFLVALGVSMEVTTRLITTAGEGIVLAICKVAPIKFGNMKMIFDLTLVAISITLSLLFLHHLDGVREGTVAAAVLVGQLARQINKPMGVVEQRCLA